MKKNTLLILHPFLLAIYPALSLLAHNISEVSVNVVFRSLILMIAITALLFGIWKLVLHDSFRAGLVTSLWVILFSSYGSVYQSLTGVKIGELVLRRHTFLLPIWLLVGVCGMVWIIRHVSDVRNLTRIFNVVGVGAILLPLVQIGIYTLRPGGGYDLRSAPNAPEVVLQVPRGQTPPDVYYIILDMYTREDVLKTVFQYDNSAFVRQLEDLGFYVAPCSRSNYHSTELSISSSLNMDYYQNLTGNQLTPNLAGWIRQSAVRQAFESANYTSVAFDSGFSPTTVREADKFYSSDQSVLNTLFYKGASSFEGVLLKNTMGILLYDVNTKLSLPTQTILDGAYITHRERILFDIDTLPQLARQPGPQFVFVHILAPHEPFVFDENGNFVSRNRPFTLNGDIEYTNEAYRTGYVGQITYLNQRIIPLIQQIIQNSDTPPVIIIQGDHGSHRTGLEDGDTPILNAYYLPGEGKNRLYPTISPVNSFRLIFDAYLGADLPLLPDETYTYDEVPTRFTLTQGTCPVQSVP